MTKRRRLPVVTAAVLVAHAGCFSTSYTPRADGRITMASEGGTPALVKDGKIYSANADGLSQAVAGNPSAEAHARSYNRGMNIFYAGYLVALGGFITGLSLQSNSDEMGVQQPDHSGRIAAGVGIAFASLALMIFAACQASAARTHYLDAINIYNDDVVPRPPPSPAMMPGPRAPPPQVGAPEVTPLPMAPPPAVPTPYESPAP